MLNLKYIRENPEKVRENLKKKFQEKKLELLDRLLALDTKYLAQLKEVEELRKKRNKITAEIATTKKAGGDVQHLLIEAKSIPEILLNKENELTKVLRTIRDLQYEIPNIIAEDVPIGRTDAQNVVRKIHGEPCKKNFSVKSHVEIAEKLNVAEFESAARVAGNGFYYLKGDLALLNQALIRFALEVMQSKGYTYVEPPLLLNKEAIHAVMPFSDFQEHAYKIDGKDQYLVATAEHPMIALFKDTIINEKELPIKLFGYSMSFRQEIGSHGIDEKGLFRTHQFNKVEQIIICKPEDSDRFYREILDNTIELFTALNLPTRTLECCSGDLADLKYKSEDLEVYSPRKEDYFEVASCSNLTTAQARRANIRVFDGKKNYVPHTLNNTALATSRAMVAILENYQNEDGTVTIPDALKQYMFGKETIGKVQLTK
jgi:seryl-tRNA synthetase